MRALVTGANGFVGPHLCRHLLEEGDEVAALSFGNGSLPSQVRVFPADIRDSAAVRHVVHAVEPDVVYHLAGISSVAAVRDDPPSAFAVNVGGTFNLFQATMALPHPPRILNVSSSHVYSDTVEEVTEATPLVPSNAYAASKAMAEWVPVLAGAQDWITVRPFNHSGPGQTADFVLSSFAAQIAEIEMGIRPPLLQVGDLDVERDFLDVRDVVRAYRLLMARGRCGETYNLASGKTVSLRSILRLFQEATPVRFDIEVAPMRQRGGQRKRIMCLPAKLHEHTGWAPSISLESTIRDLLEYWRTHDRNSARQGA